MTSLPSLSLSLCISLSLSPNVPHAQYRKRFRASYNSIQPLQTLAARLIQSSLPWLAIAVTIIQRALEKPLDFPSGNTLLTFLLMKPGWNSAKRSWKPMREVGHWRGVFGPVDEQCLLFQRKVLMELRRSTIKAGPPWFEFLVIFDFFAPW